MKISTIVTAATLLALPGAAFAQAGLNGTVTATATVGSTTVTGTARTSVETKAIARADKEIDRRVANLQDALNRIGEAQKLTSDQKASIQANINAEISSLNALKAKIDADTVLADLKTDVQSITKQYRIYALVLPQVRILAAADRVMTIAGLMSDIEAKIAARIASSTGDTSALVSLDTDLKAKFTDAETQANAAASAIANLAPDNGDATVAARNKAALKTAQGDLKTATQDLANARQDIGKILGDLMGGGAGLKGEGNASTSASTSAAH